MQELIDQLNEPDRHFPGNFDTPKQANALLMCLCQEAAEAIKAQSAEIAELREQVFWLKAARSNIAVVAENEKLKALCDQMGEALEEAMYSNSTEISIDKFSKALEAWRAIK